MEKKQRSDTVKKERFTSFGSEDFSLQIVPTSLRTRVPLHSHDFTEIVIFQRGSAIHTHYSGNEKSTYCLMQGDCFSILPREKHSYENGDGAYFSNIIFSKKIISNEISELQELSSYRTFFGDRIPGKRPHIRLNTVERKEIDKLIEFLTQVLVQRRPGYKLEAKNLLLQILLILLRKEPITAQNAQNNIPVSKKLLDKVHGEVQRFNMNRLGSKAAEITLEMVDGSSIGLSDVTTKYKVLYFYRPNCGVCAEVTPKMAAIYNEFKEKIDIEDPSKIVAITRDNFILLPYDEGKIKYQYVVTALDRLHNESKPVKKKVKL